MANQDATDLGILWTRAVDKYTQKTGQKLAHLRGQSISDVMQTTAVEKKRFESYRHDNGKLDKVRAAFGRHLDGMQKCLDGVQTIGEAASAFPPAMPVGIIFAACGHMFQAFAGVQKDYDQAEAFFDHSRRFFDNLTLLEGKTDPRPLAKAIVRTFASQLVICGIVQDMKNNGRFKQWLNALWNLESPELAAAYAEMQASIEELGATVGYATYSAIRDAYEELKATHEDVGEISEKIDELDANISRVRESMGEQLQTLYASNLGLDKKITEGFDGVQAKQDEAYAVQLRIAQMQENLLNAFEKASMPASSDTKSHSGDLPRDSANEKAQALDTVKTFFIGNSILFPRIEKVLDANRIERERIKRQRVGDSVAWLAEHPNFTRWLDGQVTCLKICGSTGMGKSFSMEAAIDLVQRSTNPPSDVAYYFVQPDLDLPQSTEAAFACAALQVVEANHRYAEQVASDIKEDVQKLVNRVNRLVYWKTSGVIEADTSTDLVDVPIWKRFFTSGYTGVASSKRRLFLILDGMDELPNGLDQLVAFLLDLQQSEAPIHVLLSTRDAAWPSDSRIQTVTIDLTRDLITPGLKSVVKHRLRSSQRLRSFSTQLKRKMYRKIVSQADSMLYVEHILRRLSHISRESIVNKELENLPRGLPEVYSSLMEECGRYRSKKQLEGLRTLFAWLAFCKRPLTLGEVITLFRASEPNEGLKLDIEEEITVKCSSILELSQSHVRGIDTKATSQEDVTEFDDDQSSDDDEMDVELFNAANVAFADQPLRRYFRSATLASATDLKDLRIAAPQAHLRLFSACIDIITKTTNQAEPQQHIQEYAVVYWKEHFCELNPEESSETMACQVVCALYLLMANVDPYAQVLSRKHISPSEFYPDRTSSTIPWYERILAWTQQGLELPAGLLPPHVMEWAMSIDRESILLTFGRGHYNVWMHNANDTSPRGYELAQRCAQLAGVLDCAIEDDPMKDGLSLVHYFSPGNMNTDVLRALGLLAWAQFWKFDFKGNRTAKNNVIKESSSYLRRSLESMHSSGMERVRLIRLLYFNRNTVGAFESTQMLKWADEGLAILDRLDPLASTVQEKQEIQEKRRELLTRKIMSGLMPLNQWEELHEACKLYRAKYGLAASLPQQDMMEAFITACDKLDPTGRQRKQLMQSLSKKERQVWLGWLFNRITTSVQRNATRISDWAGSEDVHLWITWLTEFEKSRPWRPFYGLKKRNVLWPDPYQRLVALGCLAHLYFENLHDAEQAKKIHRKILALGEPKVQDRKFGMKREVERIRNRHVGLIFAQFQDATSWSRKEALLGEAMTMPNFSDENLHGCHAGALVARMLKVVEPKKYQPFMENTFKVLVNDLKDGIASNDGTSLTALAMLLASLPSLERDALIALSLRHSVLDRELHGRVYDDENSDTHGDLSGYIAYCDRCKKSGSDWTTPLWKCLECANVDLCDACLQSHRACLREAHNDESFIHKELKDWEKLCIETHRFIRGPIKGWRGVRKGVIRVGENCFEVKDWLKSLREERWPKAWAWYWKTCGLNHDVGGEDD